MTTSKAKIRGRIVKPGPAQPLPESTDPLVWLVSRLQVDEDGQPLMQGIFSNYNDDIVLEQDQNTLVGRTDVGRGPAQGLTIEPPLHFGEGEITADVYSKSEGDARYVNVTGDTMTGPLVVPNDLRARNRIVNGAMQISQENGTTIGAVNSYYPADQWSAGISGVIGGLQIAMQDVGTWNQIYIQGVRAAFGATEYAVFGQTIEGSRVKDFRWGTPSALPAILRFDVWSSNSGTYTACIRNAALDRTFIASYSVAPSAWTTVTIPISGVTTGTWPTGDVGGLSVNIVAAAGSNYHGVLGWQTGNKLGVAGMSNAFGGVGGTFFIANVGLYLDQNNTGAPPRWEMPDRTAELLACQRYYSI